MWYEMEPPHRLAVRLEEAQKVCLKSSPFSNFSKGGRREH